MADLTDQSSIKTLNDFIDKINPDSIIVLAAIKRQAGESQEIESSNNAITSNILNALEGLIHITYVSSCAVYGEKNKQTEAIELASLIQQVNMANTK